jgi:DNA-directed RNA polymerase subunit beta
MPYLEDGTPVDMLLNPLGIPSRMNVGQIYECLLTLAANILREKYKLLPFDELQKTNQKSSSISIIYKKLNEAKQKTKISWLINLNYPGKLKLINGINGNILEKPILTGYAYMLKLMHMVDDKINSRLTGPYTMMLKQPVRGKSRNGGQRVGEMEVWALEGFGAAYTLQEMLTIKSDDLTNRPKLLYNIINRKSISKPEIPESFKALIAELQCLCIEIGIYLNSQNK